MNTDLRDFTFTINNLDAKSEHPYDKPSIIDIANLWPHYDPVNLTLPDLIKAIYGVHEAEHKNELIGILTAQIYRIGARDVPYAVEIISQVCDRGIRQQLSAALHCVILRFEVESITGGNDT